MTDTFTTRASADDDFRDLVVESNCSGSSCGGRADVDPAGFWQRGRLLGRIALVQFGRLCHHVLDRHGPLPDRGSDAGLHHRGLSDWPAAAEVDTRTHVRRSISRHGAWFFGLGAGDGDRRRDAGRAATYLVGGATTGVAAGGSAAATQASSAPSDYFVDMLLRPGPNTASAGAAQNAANPNREVGTIFARSIGKSVDFSPADRTYLAQVVAARTGLSQADAEKRVNDVITQAKEAADKARKAAAALSIWLAISMLAGAFSASLAALEGGQLRDGKWKGVFGTRGYREAHNQP